MAQRHWKGRTNAELADAAALILRVASTSIHDLAHKSPAEWTEDDREQAYHIVNGVAVLLLNGRI